MRTLIDIDPDEDRLRDLDAEFGRVNPNDVWRHLGCVGDALCAECAGIADEAKAKEATC